MGTTPVLALNVWANENPKVDIRSTGIEHGTLQLQPHYLTILKVIFIIILCLTPFSKLFLLHQGGQGTFQCFPGVLFYQYFSKYSYNWLLVISGLNATLTAKVM